MTTTPEIHWQNPRDIPTQPGTAITIKTDEGDLYNIRIGQKWPVSPACVKGWIPNLQ